MPTPQKTISLHSTQVKSDGIIISSRWNPTREQILALEEIFRGGTTTPTPYQIQKIVSMLRCFGRIEGKNVFYWFQNHKARERHKWRRQQAGYHLSLAKKRIPVSEEKKSTLAGKREIGEQHRLQLQQMNNNRISRADCVGIHDGEERESKTLQLFPCHRGYRHGNAYCGVNVKTTAVKDYAALADDQAQIASTINASFVRTPTEFYEFLPMKS